MDPAARFADLVNGPPTALQLDRACALLAAGFTGVDRSDEVLRRLDELAGRVDDRSLDGVLDAMRGRLAGNRTDYYDPRNSFLDAVLERGLGLFDHAVGRGDRGRAASRRPAGRDRAAEPLPGA
ncbi:MAG: transglutaminase family protein [Ilumatobacteraceae bacterium]